MKIPGRKQSVVSVAAVGLTLALIVGRQLTSTRAAHGDEQIVNWDWCARVLNYTSDTQTTTGLLVLQNAGTSSETTYVVAEGEPENGVVKVNRTQEISAYLDYAAADTAPTILGFAVNDTCADPNGTDASASGDQNGDTGAAGGGTDGGTSGTTSATTGGTHAGGSTVAGARTGATASGGSTGSIAGATTGRGTTSTVTGATTGITAGGGTTGTVAGATTGVTAGGGTTGTIAGVTTGVTAGGGTTGTVVGLTTSLTTGGLIGGLGPSH